MSPGTVQCSNCSSSSRERLINLHMSIFTIQALVHEAAIKLCLTDQSFLIKKSELSTAAENIASDVESSLSRLCHSFTCGGLLFIKALFYPFQAIIHAFTWQYEASELSLLLLSLLRPMFLLHLTATHTYAKSNCSK